MVGSMPPFVVGAPQGFLRRSFLKNTGFVLSVFRNWPHFVQKQGIYFHPKGPETGPHV